ncbi:hypothetical protein [Planococcus sp. ISL-109]|nr:hypothetical protein [Planococcus sp. ISL-109]MBT2584040.1 hypothetical protein [Planococcus sp. ISL-109]
MSQIEQQAREIYTKHIPIINDFAKTFEDLKRKLSMRKLSIQVEHGK